jgi:dTDP-4-amino-4,6-dideoxygalactose transaminase
MQVPPFSLREQLDGLGEELDQAVLRVLRSGQYIGGTSIADFEEAFAKAVGVPHAVGCNSGTDALILALRGLGIGPGDEVITASFSFFATAEAVSAVGATPVFVDVDPVSYLIDLNQLEAAITPATKVLMPVHLFGRPVDMERLCAIAGRYGLKVVEDCAQATGSSWAGRPVGSWGDVGCFSFFPTKNLGGAGDGGAVTCRDGFLAQQMRELAVHGMPRRYLHTQLGYNSRLDAIQAAVLNVKLPHLSHWVERRRSIAARYREQLAHLDAINLPADVPDGHSWNQFVVRIPHRPAATICCDNSCNPSADSANFDLPEACCRDWLKQQLQAAGVSTIIYYPIPIHRQPAYAYLGYGPGSLPVTERLCSEVLSLPIFPELTLEQQHQVVQGLCQLIGTKANGTATDNGTAKANGTATATGTATDNANSNCTANATANATATSTVMAA